MNERKKYIRPAVMNLSGFGVVGMGFLGGGTLLGLCQVGNMPTDPGSECANGNTPTQGIENCSPTGSLPLSGYCRTGSNVINYCATGSYVTG